MNPKGVVAVNGHDDVTILACPAELQTKKTVGMVQLWNLNNLKNQECMAIKAHESTLGVLTLNHKGTLLATASEKGTVIRVFETKKGKMIQELKRGTDSAVIFSIDFHFDDEWLSIISDSGTLHVYNLAAIEPQQSSPIKKGKKKLPMRVRARTRPSNSKNTKNPKSM